MADISSNLLYYYKFDRSDLSGTTLKNWATNNYDATVSSRSVISNKNYYIGNSSMECANGGMNVPLTLGAAGFSFSFWLSATHVQNAFYFNSSFINFNHYNNVLRIYGVIDFSMPQNGNSNTWMHIIISWSNTNSLTLYLNGKYNNINATATYPTVNNVSFDIYGGSYFFDDFRIYNYAISSQEDLNYLLYYPNYKIYKNNLSKSLLLSKLNSNFYDLSNQNVIFNYEPRNIIPGTIVLLSGNSTAKKNNLGNYAYAVNYSSTSQAKFNSQYSSLYVVDDISGSISIINMQTGIINVLPTMDTASNNVENRYKLNSGIKSIAFDTSQTYYYVANGSYVQQMNYSTNLFIKNINNDALTNIRYCITDSSNILYISHATGINKINLSGVIPTTTTSVITNTALMTQMANSSMYPNKLFTVDVSNSKIYVINTNTNANYALTLTGYIMTSLCFDSIGNLYVSTTSKNIFLIPSRVITGYTVDTTLSRTGNYYGAYDWMNYAGTTGTGSTGDGELAINATFSNISNIMMDAGNNMYICDSSNATIRKIINKGRTTNFLNQITDEMGITSQYDISTLYSPTYSIGTNQISNYCIETSSSGIGADIKASNYNIIDNSGLLLYYRFNSIDMNGVNLANYATGFPVYDASLSAAGLVNSNDFVLDNAGFYNIASGNIKINNSVLSAGSWPTINGISVAFWVKSNNTGTNGKILDFGNGNPSPAYAFFISPSTSSGNNSFQHAVRKASASTNYYTYYTINNNIWHHFCVTLTYDTSVNSIHNVYIDGSLYYTGTGLYPTTTTYTFCYIGKSNFAADPSFNGSIDDFRLYNRIVSASEVSTLYNNGTNNNISFVDLRSIGAIPTLTVTNTVYSYPIVNNSTPIRNGIYNIVQSSSATASNSVMYAFDSSNATFHQSLGSNYTNGIYNNTNTYNTTFSDSTVINRDYSQIKLPYMLKLTSYTVVNNPSYATISIASYILAGSTDGITWDYIDYVNMGTNAVLSFDVSLNTYTNGNSWTWTYRNMGQKYYNYFRFIGYSMSSGSNYRLAELKLYGVGQYLINVPITQQYTSFEYDTIPPLTSNTTTISGNIPTILNGNYIASTSSNFDATSNAYYAFDNNLNNFWQSSSLYNSTGAYIGTVTTTFKNTTSAITISGEWIQIQLPYSLRIGGYYILPRSSTQLVQFPKSWYLVGSNDGLNWYTIDYESAYTPTTPLIYGGDFGNGYANKNYYSYFRLIFMTSNNNSGTTVVSVNQIQLWGTSNPLEYYENTSELPSYNAVPTLTSTSTTISGNMPALLNGIYNTSVSSFYGVGYESYIPFANTGAFWNSGDGVYNGSGTYVGTVSTSFSNSSVITAYGEWIQIKLPYALLLTGYSMVPRSDFYKYQFPKSWYLVGSNDGTTWYAIDYQNYATITNITYYSANSYGNKNYYSYFRIIVLNITSNGNGNGVTISTIKLQGTGR